MQTLLYSRSCLKDYRWIYLTDLCEKEKSNYLDDYRNFENKRDFHLKTPHLYVRFDTEFISIYKFIDTNQVDSCNRHIYALSGFVFSGMEYVFASRLLEYVVSYFFCNQDRFFTALEQVSDAVTEQTLSIEFDVNAVMAECKYNNDVKKGAQFVKDFIKNHTNTSFFMTEEKITPIIEEKDSPSPKKPASETPVSPESSSMKAVNNSSEEKVAKKCSQKPEAVYEWNSEKKPNILQRTANALDHFFENKKPKGD